MGNEPFTHMFPEWMLSEALAKCLSKSKRDLWTWQVVDPADGHNTVVSLADVFSRPTPPQIEPEWVFAKDDYARYGIDQVRWKPLFGALAPTSPLTARTMVSWFCWRRRAVRFPRGRGKTLRNLSTGVCSRSAGRSRKRGFTTSCRGSQKSSAANASAIISPPEKTSNPECSCGKISCH